MRIYYITIFIVFILSLLAENIINNKDRIEEESSYNSFFVFLIALALIIVAGLRWRVGTDYDQYARNYMKYGIEVWEHFNLLGEPGMMLIAKISSFIYDDYATMFLISSIITIGLSIKTISKHSNMLTFSILIYIFIGVWHGSFNGVRQYIASAIIFAGHHYIIEKKPVKYIVIVILASLFHVSALVTILFYFVPQKTFKLKHIIALIITSVIIITSYDFIFSIIRLITGKGIIGDGYIIREVNPLRIAVAFSPLLIYHMFTLKSKIEAKESFYINILFINAILALVTKNSAYLTRFIIYTSIFSVLGIPTIINFKDKYFRFLIKYIIIISYATYWYIGVSNSPDLSNFKWIFNRL